MPILCIDFGGTEIKLGMMAGATVLASATIAVSGSEADLASVQQAAFLLPGTIEGVGLAMPGVVDRQRGALIAAHGKYDWAIGRDLCAWASAIFRAPAIIENDARAALLGETTYGCAAGEADAVLLTLGTGIGSAALIAGVLLRGAHDHAGVLGGHIIVDPDGPRCNCGNTGCAEAIASTWALQRDAAADHALAAALCSPAATFISAQSRPSHGDDHQEEQFVAVQRKSLGLRDLFENSEYPPLAPIVARYLQAWGAAIVNLCHAYDPTVVIVSGGVLRSADLILAPLTRYVHDHLWPSSFRPPLIAPQAPQYSVLLGLSAVFPGEVRS